MRSILILFYLLLAGCNNYSSPPASSPPPPPSPAPSITEEQRLREKLLREQTERMEIDPPSSGFSSPVVKVPSASDVMNQLQTAAMAFNLPGTTDIQELILAQLKIDYHLTKEELAQELEPQIGKYYIITEDIKVSKVLKAELIAPTFNVTNLTAAAQALSETEPTTWEWLLIPNSSGEHLVTLKIDAYVEVEDEKIERTIQTYKKTLKVTVTSGYIISQWFGEHWEWLFTSLVFPLAIWFWNRKRKKKKSNRS